MDARIPPWELLGRLGEDEVVVVDCRGEAEWRRVPVQIPGALRMSAQEIRDAPWTLPDDELIVLYDGMNDCSVARACLRVLHLAGRRAVCLEGGLAAWLALGFPIERVTGYAERGEEGRVDVCIAVDLTHG